MEGIFERVVRKVFTKAHIEIGGSKPWDIRIAPGKERRFYTRVVLLSSLGLGEAWMNREFECEDLKAFLWRLICYLDGRKRANAQGVLFPEISWPHSLPEAWIRTSRIFVNRHSIARSKRDIEYHYDLDNVDGNDWYEVMLGDRMAYTGGRSEAGKPFNLALSHDYKNRDICKKIGARSGMEILEVGCGWGEFAKIATREFGAKVTGITLSKNQFALLQKELSEEIRKGLFQAHLMDYREVPGTFQAVVSCGMFEHVGLEEYSKFFQKMSDCLEEGSPFLFESIEGGGGIDPFTDKHIFPSGVVPKPHQRARAAKPFFVHKSTENLGGAYARACEEWVRNIQNGRSILLKRGYSDKTIRKYEFAFTAYAIKFATDELANDQVLYAKRRTPGLDSNVLAVAA